jgi:hypothetical protein
MSKKQRKRRKRPRKPATSRRPTGGIQLVTPEGDALVFTEAQYQHAAPEEIRQILAQAGDFGVDDDLEPDSDGSWYFPWLETGSKTGSPPAPIGQRVLASLTLTPATLKAEATSRQRLDRCRWRLEQLLADRIRLVETKTKSVDRALRESESRAEPEEPFVPPSEVIAEIEEKILREWIDTPIPALGGLTPRQAVKTPEGRQDVLELIAHAEQMQSRMKKTPGSFAPDYRKVKKMLGLE